MRDVNVVLMRDCNGKSTFQQEEKSFHQQIRLKFNDETKFHIWTTDLYGTANWTLRRVDQKYVESSEK